MYFGGHKEKKLTEDRRETGMCVSSLLFAGVARGKIHLLVLVFEPDVSRRSQVSSDELHLVRTLPALGATATSVCQLESACRPDGAARRLAEVANGTERARVND